LLAIFGVTICNRNEDRLYRRQPYWKGAGVVLDQHRDETLEAAKDGSVNDHDPMFGVVRADVFQVEPLRHHIVQLDRGALPLPTDRIRNVNVDFWSVEGTIAFVQLIPDAGPVECTFKLGFCMIPR